MKFEYDKTKEEPNGPVAMIDEDGDIWFEYDESWACIHEGALITEDDPESLYSIVKVFYPGDKLTITF